MVGTLVCCHVAQHASDTRGKRIGRPSERPTPPVRWVPWSDGLVALHAWQAISRPNLNEQRDGQVGRCLVPWHVLRLLPVPLEFAVLAIR